MYRDNPWISMDRGEERPIDWRKFEQLFDELLPNAFPGIKGRTLTKVGQFVRDVLDRTVPETGKPPAAPIGERSPKPGSRTGAARSPGEAPKPFLSTDVSETEKLVKVRIRIPAHVDPRKLQLFVNGDILKIEGPLGNKQTVRLPAPVLSKKGTAVFRDGLLNIRLRKLKRGAFRELYIRYPSNEP